MPQTVFPKVPYILFADDDESTIGILKELCKQRGWHGDFVNTPREIIAKVNQNCINMESCYDAIVADINYFNQEKDLPRITGITAISQIREVYKNIPVIFISAYVSSLLTKDIENLNAISISKPFDPEVLFDKLEHLIKWNRISTRHMFTEDRRKNSVNFSDNRRRSTDRIVTMPKILEKVIEEIRLEKGRQ